MSRIDIHGHHRSLCRTLLQFLRDIDQFGDLPVIRRHEQQSPYGSHAHLRHHEGSHVRGFRHAVRHGGNWEPALDSHDPEAIYLAVRRPDIDWFCLLTGLPFDYACDIPAAAYHTGNEIFLQDVRHRLFEDTDRFHFHTLFVK